MCKRPITLKDGQKVRCSHCIECLITRSKEWATRLEIEQKGHTSGVFLTLTYNEEHAIWIDNGEKTVTTLDKSDFQKFMKRLRLKQSEISDNKIRYFACGEYGGKTKRAHYHAIVFGIEKKIKNSLQKIWNKGYVQIGEVTPKSIRYVANYMLLKDVDLEKGQAKPFTLMSRKPAIGHGYVNQINTVHHQIDKLDSMKIAGKQTPVTYQYYLNKMVDKETQAKMKSERMKKFQEKRQELLDKAEQINPLDPIGQMEKTKQEQVEAKQRKFNKYRKQNKL